MGHDVGHTPFGHKGESLLNEICQKENIGCFYHNAQSVRVLKNIEDLNISLQTLDGILAHNGEILINKYEYNKDKTKEEFLEELNNTLTIKGYSKKIKPMTLEGCVVRLSDVIAYIGRDIEDAIILNGIKRGDIPKEITEVLGDTNSKIVDTLIKDVIRNSLDKPYLKFSNEVFKALISLQEWNYKYIYDSDLANKNYDIIEKLFNDLYYFYLEKVTKEQNVELEKCTQSEKTLYSFINKMGAQEPNIKRIIIDYIAGQTDKFFLNECKIYLGQEI